MGEHNFEALKAHILPLSVSSRFDLARKEWELFAVEISEETAFCPCGHEIKEHCYIRNRHNGHETHVGNVCIRQFMLIETGPLFAGLKRIVKDPGANANTDLIEHARQAGYIYDKEYQFLMDTRRKRKMSDAQIAWKQKINRRITSKIVVRRRRQL